MGAQGQKEPTNFTGQIQPKSKNPLMIDLTGGSGKVAQPMIPQQQVSGQGAQTTSSRDSLPSAKKGQQASESQPKNVEKDDSAYKIPAARQTNSLE